MTNSDSRPDAQPAPLVADSVDESALMETHPDIPTIGPLAGAFTWHVVADTWHWSDEMFVIHGFAPHEVVPTTALFMAHKHPSDRAKAAGVVDRFLSTGERFACYHRILDAQSRERHVLVVADGTTGPDGTVTEMSGFMIDLTDTRRNDVQPAISEALNDALTHRDDIEMAKGALMMGFSTNPDEAFSILRAASNHSNVKVSEIARRIVHEFSLGDRPAPALEDLHSLISRVTEPDYAASSDDRPAASL